MSVKRVRPTKPQEKDARDRLEGARSFLRFHWRISLAHMSIPIILLAWVLVAVPLMSTGDGDLFFLVVLVEAFLIAMFINVFKDPPDDTPHLYNPDSFYRLWGTYTGTHIDGIAVPEGDERLKELTVGQQVDITVYQDHRYFIVDIRRVKQPQPVSNRTTAA